jgi:hypothetical protein
VRELTVVALPILLAITLHEAAHGYVADGHCATLGGCLRIGIVARKWGSEAKLA